MRKLLYVLGFGLIAACSPSNPESEKSFYAQYFESQIDSLLSENYGLLRHTSEGEEVEQERLDTMHVDLWERELRGFLNAENPNISDTANYQYAVDTAGRFEIRRLSAKDSTADLQFWEETRVDGAIQLITWRVQKKSVLIDRYFEMTYQPMKGYRIKMKEDAAWASAREYEIFAEFVEP